MTAMGKLKVRTLSSSIGHQRLVIQNLHGECGMDSQIALHTLEYLEYAVGET